MIGEETSEQLDIVPMQIHVIKHIRRVYGCRGCEIAPGTADQPAQLIEKSMASPSVLAMLLTTKYVDGLPLHRFETVLSRHVIEIPRQTLARWVIQCGEHLQPLLNLMRDRLLESPVIHCEEARVQVLKEADRDPTSESWMWVQASGPPDQKVVLFDYTSSGAGESEPVHHVHGSATNVADIMQVAKLLHGKDSTVYVDAGCTSVEKRKEHDGVRSSGKLRRGTARVPGSTNAVVSTRSSATWSTAKRRYDKAVHPF